MSLLPLLFFNFRKSVIRPLDIDFILTSFDSAFDALSNDTSFVEIGPETKKPPISHNSRTGYNIRHSNPVSHANLKNRPFEYLTPTYISPTLSPRLKCPTTFLYPTHFPLNNSSTPHTYLPAFPTF